MQKKIIAALSTGAFLLAGCQTASTPSQPSPAGNDEIRIEAPMSLEVIKSPLTVKGEVRGYWMFEAIFDVRLEDNEGRELATAPGTATDGWMTEDFVPFESTLTFNPGNAAEGKIIFLQAYPSGGLEGDERKTFEMPVRFQE